ncbi:FHA domain-containing protein [Cellulomonas sp. KH9]|uniref:FHA domain-containing protein n=1 Tax=Cellulomonas sp. KH9 TaxID=1855324 RepID=UPI0008E150E0|nr:FHA domain-containing protein [Cellulomonas sp. KH9]SFJ61601.1 FHA domain-containing protein [Cellulomonas sp. KH9]
MNHATPATAAIAPWPRVTAVVHSGTTATLIVNDVERTCEAPSEERLRTGVLARATAVAGTVGRPVRLRLAAAGSTQLLAVRSDGAVHRLADDGTMDAARLSAPADAGCRRCGTQQPLTATTCPRCGTLEPHRVERSPFPVLDAADLTLPDAAVAAHVHARATSSGRGAAPSLVVRVEGGPARTVTGAVALGRNPAAAPGRTPVVVHSPGTLVSKTHAIIEVDAGGVVRVTDCRSTNGTTLLGDPPLPLSPDQPHVVPPGVAVRMGDVTVHVEAVGTGADRS